MMKRAVAGLVCVGLLTACGDDSQPADGTDGDGGTGGQGAGGQGGDGPTGIAALGAGQHTPDSVDILIVSQPDDPLNVPRDLAFNPVVPGQLWVVSRTDSSMTVFDNFGAEGQIATRYAGSNNAHFMVQPSSLAFSDTGWFATIHETDEKTQGPNGTPADFMGPSLWNSQADFDGGHSGHYDMLHNSPNGMGIAWETGNAYWVFDGYHSSLTRYDFVLDHGPGGSDHSDGIVSRYVEGAVIRRPDVPSHMEYDPGTGYLYVADTGNNRVVILDTKSGTKGQAVGPNYDNGTDQHRVDGASLWPVVDGATQGMTAPSGLAIANGVLYVSCFDTSKIYGFSMEGELIDYLETGIPGGQMMGLEVDAEGNLYTLNAIMNQVIRISPKAAPEG